MGGTSITDEGYLYDLPNYTGDLLSADHTQTPLLSMIGGLNGGKKTSNFEFDLSSEYDFPDAAQPAITETASLTASSYRREFVRDRQVNVCQIFMESIHLTYVKMSNQARILHEEVGSSGYAYSTAGEANNVADEMAWQKTIRIDKIARDVEKTFIDGAYQYPTSESVAAKTRGLMAATALATSSTVAAGTADLSKALIDQLLRTMAEAGARFKQPVAFMNGFQVQQVSDIYGYAPQDRLYGGVAIKTVLTDFCQLGIVYNPHMGNDDFLVADLAFCSPVFQEVPGKGLLFYEPLAKSGAAEEGQIFGQIGLDYGPAFMHGSITGLTTS
jgi:hypothetical protein